MIELKLGDELYFEDEDFDVDYIFNGTDEERVISNKKYRVRKITIDIELKEIVGSKQYSGLTFDKFQGKDGFESFHTGSIKFYKDSKELITKHYLCEIESIIDISSLKDKNYEDLKNMIYNIDYMFFNL